MNPLLRRPIRQNRPRGLSISEVLIALAITSMLLTAIAAAFVSSSQVIENNDRFFRATQAGRVALNQMLTEIRRCESANVTATQIDVIRPDETRPANESIRHYKVRPDPADPTRYEIVLFFTDSAGNTDESKAYPLCHNLTSGAPFTCDMEKDVNNTDYVARVSIRLNVQVDNNKIQLSGSAVPRRSLVFK